MLYASPCRNSSSNSSLFGTEGTTDIVENPESRRDTRPPRYTMTRDVRQDSGVVLCLQRKAEHGGERPIVHLIPCSGSQHPWNEMDEGASTLLPGYPIGHLAIAEAINRRERGTYPSTGSQTTVCMALVVGGRASHIPPCTHVPGHWILAAPDKEK